MNFPGNCMGIAPQDVTGPCAAGLDVAFGMYDFSMLEWVCPKPGFIVPRLVWYGKLENEKAAIHPSETSSFFIYTLKIGNRYLVNNISGTMANL